MNTRQRYELIRLILNGEKTVKQVHQETQVPTSTIYRYLSRFRQSGGQIESLSDKPSTALGNPKWLTEEEKDRVVEYKLCHPEKSTRQIAAGLGESGMLSIHDRTVANILSERRLPSPLCPTNQQNSETKASPRESNTFFLFVNKG